MRSKVSSAPELSYRVIDQFAEAALLGRLPKIAVPTHSSKMLGPLLELRQLSRQQDNIRNADQSWLAKEGYQKLLTDLDNHRPTWASFSGRKIGYMRVSHLSENIDAWTDFTQRYPQV